MKVAILGTGAMGSALGAALTRGGASVVVGSRDAARGLDHAAAVAAAETIVLAVAHRHALQLIDVLGTRLAGKIVVDPTTPWGDEIGATSASEEIARRVPPSTPVVAAWKTNFAAELGLGSGDVLVAGDEVAAKAAIAELICSTGFRALDAGALVEARVLEGMCRMMMPILRSLGPAKAAIPAWRFAALPLAPARTRTATGKSSR